MALSENPIVVGQACKTMGEKGANPPPKIVHRVANSLARSRHYPLECSLWDPSVNIIMMLPLLPRPPGRMAECGPQIAKQLIAQDVISAVVSLMKAPVQVNKSGLYADNNLRCGRQTYHRDRDQAKGLSSLESPIAVPQHSYFGFQCALSCCMSPHSSLCLSTHLGVSAVRPRRPVQPGCRL